jgi:fructose-1,6-bisphosphatase/inositol monophosphatase family enzyme
MTDERLEFMKYLATEAGSILMSFYGKGVKSALKADRSIVTEADLRVSEFVQTEIPKRFPGEAILDEEAKDSLGRLTKSGIWIIDPLDGSGDFKRGEDDFCFLGAYAENGIPTIGVVCEPKKDRMFFAHRGNGAYVTQNGRTSRLEPLRSVAWDESLVGHPKNYKGDKYTKLYEMLGIPEKRLMRSGSMGTRMMQVALQQTHMILGYTKSVKEWDIAAGDAILQERGISVTDMLGNPLIYNQEIPKTHNGILVVHPDIKREALQRLSGCYGRLDM